QVRGPLADVAGRLNAPGPVFGTQQLQEGGDEGQAAPPLARADPVGDRLLRLPLSPRHRGKYDPLPDQLVRPVPAGQARSLDAQGLVELLAGVEDAGREVGRLVVDALLPGLPDLFQ